MAISCNGQGCSGHKDHIEKYYNDIVRCLAAASQCVPCTRVGVAKHWWTANLDELKQQCIDICNLWKLVGCPRNGTINSERLRYKQAIKQAIIDADTGLNEDFRKSWRKRFCSRNIKPAS